MVSLGAVVKSVTNVADSTKLFTVLEQVGVDERVEWAGSWEVSWTQSLDSDVELLTDWVGERESEHLLGHRVVPSVDLLVWLMVGNVEFREVLHVVIEIHEEGSIITMGMASFFKEFRSPLSIMVTPWTLVVL